MRARSSPFLLRGKPRGSMQMAWCVFLAMLLGVSIALAWFLGLFGSGCVNAKLRQVEADMKSFESGLQWHRRITGSYPSDSQGLDALVKRPADLPASQEWQQFMTELPPDPWRQPYLYNSAGKRHPEKWEIISTGPDGMRDTGDDLSTQDD